MAGLTWRKSGEDQWVATVDKTFGYYVITFLEDRREIFVGDNKMATKVKRYYELEARGHVVDEKFWHFQHAAQAAKQIEEKRT